MTQCFTGPLLSVRVAITKAKKFVSVGKAKRLRKALIQRRIRDPESYAEAVAFNKAHAKEFTLRRRKVMPVEARLHLNCTKGGGPKPVTLAKVNLPELVDE
jgi:hypothetical protein